MNTKQRKNPIQFKGQGGEFFGIWIVNILLSIITLGIYSAWAKVRTKRYFYGNTFISGDNFEYHATPMQLLKGRLVALVILLVWVVSNSVFPPLSIVLLVLFYLALPWLLWSHARFDSAMTSYRNVRFAFNGSLKGAYRSILGRGMLSLLAIVVYIVLMIISANTLPVVAVVLGLGLILVMVVLYAWLVAGIHQYFASGYQYGDWTFSAQIETRFFLKTYLKAILLGGLTSVAFMIVMGIVVLSIKMTYPFTDELAMGEGYWLFAYIMLPYVFIIAMSLMISAYTTTRVRNYVFSKLGANLDSDPETQFNFVSTFSVWDYMVLVISNFFLQVFTVGLARPWVMVRTTRYVAHNTAV
ncbi:YjgN family protein, partial [Vibrio fujianensis]|uniref:YjgN family protein n=1 Tax=Vibrio fujianensis TaxID=1974215 RepID=UPI001FED1B92